MTNDNAKNIPDKNGDLLRDLQTLLEKQIRLAHKGDMTGVESLGEQAGSLIELILKGDLLKQTGFEKQREKLLKLYEQLSVTISAKKSETSGQLSRIRKGKKTVAAYRGNI